MKINSFEEILSWKKGKELAIKIYKILENNKDFGFTDQLQRATISISNNIAEGFERQNNNELVRFLYIAKGSCGEVRSMLHIGKELNYFEEETYQDLYNSTEEISKLLSGFIKSIS